jgi:hypothetical protein
VRKGPEKRDGDTSFHLLAEDSGLLRTEDALKVFKEMTRATFQGREDISLMLREIQERWGYV